MTADQLMGCPGMRSDNEECLPCMSIPKLVGGVNVVI